MEYLLRQQSKVKNPRSLVKVVRAHTRELKRATRREHEKAQVEALTQVSKEAIRGLFDVAEKGVQGIFQVAASAAGDPNPITFGLKAVSLVLFLKWLCTAYPDFAKTTHLNTFCELFSIPGGQEDQLTDLATDTSGCAHEGILKIEATGFAAPSVLFQLRDVSGTAAKVVPILNLFLPVQIVSNWLLGTADTASVCNAVRAYVDAFIEARKAEAAAAAARAAGDQAEIDRLLRLARAAGIQ